MSKWPSKALASVHKNADRTHPRQEYKKREDDRRPLAGKSAVQAVTAPASSTAQTLRGGQLSMVGKHYGRLCSETSPWTMDLPPCGSKACVVLRGRHQLGSILHTALGIQTRWDSAHNTLHTRPW